MEMLSTIDDITRLRRCVRRALRVDVADRDDPAALIPGPAGKMGPVGPPSCPDDADTEPLRRHEIRLPRRLHGRAERHPALLSSIVDNGYHGGAPDIPRQYARDRWLLTER